MATKKETSTEIFVTEQKRETLNFCIMGTTPLIHNRMSQKVLQTLLCPAPRKNAAEKAQSLKHNPLEEYRNSPYTTTDEADPTLVTILPTGFKGGMMTAALDMPGVAKTQIKRQVYVDGQITHIYGVPEMMMAVTRSADINKTPDVRTRAVMRKWACRLSISYTVPILNQQSVSNLLAAAGIVSGVGDWRQEKGSGNYGCYKLTTADDPEFLEVVAKGGRQAQKHALENPKFYDQETEDLYKWFETETKRRGMKVAA